MVRGHAGANGGTTSTGELMKKTFQWVTNSKELTDSVSAKLGSEMLYYCKPLLGKELRQSAKYPDALVKSILQAVRVEARGLRCRACGGPRSLGRSFASGTTSISVRFNSRLQRPR